MSANCAHKLVIEGCRLRYYALTASGSVDHQVYDIPLHTETLIMQKDSHTASFFYMGIEANISYVNTTIYVKVDETETLTTYDNFDAFLADIRSRQNICGSITGNSSSGGDTSVVTPDLNLGRWTHNDGTGTERIIVSTSSTAGNLLQIGADGGSLLTASQLSNLLSLDTDNGLVQGGDDKLFSKNIFNSNGSINNLRSIELGGNTFKFTVAAADTFVITPNGVGAGVSLQTFAGIQKPTAVQLVPVPVNPGQIAADTIWIDSDNNALYHGAINLDIKTSTTSGNLIGLGGDGGVLLQANAAFLNEIISSDADNALVLGGDNKLYLAVASAGSISADGNNLLTLGTDTKPKLVGTNLLSSDGGNVLTVGGDGKLYGALAGASKYILEFDSGDWSVGAEDTTLTITAAQHGKGTARVIVEVYQDLGAVSQKVDLADNFATDSSGTITLSMPNNFPGPFTGFVIII